MKKILSLALATACVVAMSAVAMAAGSVSDLTGATTTETTAGDSGSITVTISAVEVSQSTLISELLVAEDAATYVEETLASIGTEVDVASIAIIGSLDIAFDSKGSYVWVPTQVTTYVSVASGSAVYAIHEYADGQYELCKTKYENGQYYVYANSGSPFLLIVAEVATTTVTSSGFPSGFSYDAPYGYWDGDTFVWYGFFGDDGVFVYTTDVDVNGNAISTATTTTSPVTGETAAAAAAVCVMLFAGVAVCGLVRKEQL